MTHTHVNATSDESRIFGRSLPWQTTPYQIRYLLPALICSFIFVVFVTDTVNRTLKLNDDQLVYALDDAYIHMSIASNFVEHRVWGITPYAFSSTTSSPLWTILLTLVYAIIGVNQTTSLVMNLVIGVLLLFAANNLLARHDVPLLYRFVVLMGLIVFTPLNTLALTGMEHLLQILTVVLFIDYAVHHLSQPEHLRGARTYWYLPVLATLVTTTRYEGMFLVGIVGALLLIRRQIKTALLVVAFGLAPIVFYGLIGLSNDWQFLPSPLLIKSGAFTYLKDASWSARYTYLITDTYNIFANQHILSLPLLAGLTLIIYRYEKLRRFWDAGTILLVVFVAVTLANVRLVSWPDPGTFSRYEAYLISLALLVIPAALGSYLPRRLTFSAVPVVSVGIILVAFLLNDIHARYTRIVYQQPVVTATTEIYRQQYQIARFLATYYDDTIVAANDIGAINYFTEIHNLDLWGLGSIEVARARQDNRYSSAFIQQLADEKGIELAIIYDNWFDMAGGVPQDWILVERWQAERNPVILGSKTVSFYVMDADDVQPLRDNLDAFALTLPDGIIRLDP